MAEDPGGTYLCVEASFKEMYRNDPCKLVSTGPQTGEIWKAVSRLLVLYLIVSTPLFEGTYGLSPTRWLLTGGLNVPHTPASGSQCGGLEVGAGLQYRTSIH